MNRRGGFVPAFIMFQQFLIKRLIGQQSRLAFIQHGGQRVQAQFVEVFADEFETKAVKRADVRGIKQRELLLPMRLVRVFQGFFVQHPAEALFHFGGGGLGEGNDEDFINRSFLPANAIKAAFDQRMRLAGAGAGHDEHVATWCHSLLLRFRKRPFVSLWRSHL